MALIETSLTTISEIRLAASKVQSKYLIPTGYTDDDSLSPL